MGFGTRQVRKMTFCRRYCGGTAINISQSTTEGQDLTETVKEKDIGVTTTASFKSPAQCAKAGKTDQSIFASLGVLTTNRTATSLFVFTRNV